MTDAPTAAQIDQLTTFLDDPARPGGTLQYRELRGFIFAIATAPVLVQPSEWLPAICDGEEAGFGDLEEAEAIMSTIMGCYNETVGAVRNDERISPGAVGIDDSSEEALRQWGMGFAGGVDWLEEAWDPVLDALPGSEAEHFENAFQDLTVWVNPVERQREYRISDEQLEEMLESCREMIPDSLAVIAEIGITAYEAMLTARTPVSVPASVGRNDPRPCGSGKKYKRCCLGN